MAQTKNLCAQIPTALHAQVCAAREQSGLTTAQYITNLLLEYYEMKENGGKTTIDLMSFCTLHRQVRSNAVALCGLYQGPLDTYLRENPHLKQIVLCLDADGPGREATEKFQAEYAEKGYTVSARAPAQGKDWNECLQLCGRARERRDQRQAAAR